MPDMKDIWTPPRAWRILLLAAFLVIASVFDAMMTLQFVALGVEEANPFVVPILQLGSKTFLLWKMSIGLCAAAALGFGCRLKRWVWLAFNGVVWAYLALTCYHFFGLLVIR